MPGRGLELGQMKTDRAIAGEQHHLAIRALDARGDRHRQATPDAARWPVDQPGRRRDKGLRPLAKLTAVDHQDRIIEP